ncbi:MAG: C2H2-type zinc finger protein [Nitrososphaeraceae archaeon]
MVPIEVPMSSWISKILFPNKNKNVPDKCDQCGQKFKKYDELIAHARHVHHDTIVKCNDCGREFIHEKDRLHHVREEHKQKVDYRTHKDSYTTKKIGSLQDQVDESTKNFGDNF